LTVSDGFKTEHEMEVDFTFQERARLARDIFAMTTPETPVQLLHRRVQGIKDWMALCKLRSRRLARRAQTFEAFEPNNNIVADTFPLTCSPTQCLFCLGDEGMSLESRRFSFSRPDNLRRHVNNLHLQQIRDKQFSCPHPACAEELKGVMHFKTHAALVHSVDSKK
jgi:hypothetical protein